MSKSASRSIHTLAQKWHTVRAGIYLFVLYVGLVSACSQSPTWIAPASGNQSTELPVHADLTTSEPIATISPTATAQPIPTEQNTATDESSNENETALVARVLDGDTIEVMVDGINYRLRYIGIDSPEDGQPYSSEATEANRLLVESKKVILEKDVSETDRYDRLLRYVYLLDGTFVNAELVRAGYARAAAYPPDVKYHEFLLEYELEAQQNQRGLWAPIAATAEPTAAENSDSAEPGLEATVIIDPACSQFDAPGNDNDNKNEEYICLTNQSTSAIDLTGWVLHDEYGWSYPFSGFQLPSGASARLRSGCGIDSEQDLYWCKDETAVWNNGGDCAYLLDNLGNVVQQYCY